MSDGWNINFYRRPLSDEPIWRVTPRMLHNARIGRSYWSVSTEQIPPTKKYRIILQGLIKDLPSSEAAGCGVVFLGPFGSGKTSAGCILLKAAMARGGQSFFVSALELKSAYDRRIYALSPEGVQVWDMATKCQIVLIDDLGAEIGPTVAGGDVRVAEELIRARYNERLTTYITTNMKLSELMSTYKALASILSEPSRYRHIVVKEVNWRKQ